MDAYIYQSALLCENCASRIEQEKAKDGYVVKAEEDSDNYPCGPYSNGGGESDTPQHCDSCNVFLENPLTDDGQEHVKSALSEGTGNPLVLAEWREYYLTD